MRSDKYIGYYSSSNDNTSRSANDSSSRPGAWRNDRRGQQRSQHHNGYNGSGRFDLDQGISALESEIKYTLERHTERQTKTFDKIFEVLSCLQNQHAQMENTIQQLQGGGMQTMPDNNQQWQPMSQQWNSGGQQWNAMQGMQPMQQQPMFQQQQAMPSGGQQWQPVPAGNQQWQPAMANQQWQYQGQQCQQGQHSGNPNMQNHNSANLSMENQSNVNPNMQQVAQLAGSSTAMSNGCCAGASSTSMGGNQSSGPTWEKTGDVDVSASENQVCHNQPPMDNDNAQEEDEDLDPDAFITCSELAGTEWEKTRIWKVVNLDSEEDGDLLNVTTQAVPYAPSKGHMPTRSILVARLRNGDLVKQIGHSKKVRGHMVMPVLLEDVDDVDNDVSDREAKLSVAVAKETQRLGWTTRRVVNGQNWFEEVEQASAAEEQDCT